MTDQNETIMLQPAKTLEEAQRLLSLGQEMFQEGRYSECHDCCLGIFDHFSSMLEAHFLYGINAYVTQNYEPAKAAFEHILSENPQHGPCYAYLAHIYQELGDFERSDQCLNAVIQSGTDDPQAQYLIGSTLYAKANNYIYLGDKEAAKKTTLELLERAENSGQAHWLLSQIVTAKDKKHIEAMQSILKADVHDNDRAFLQYASGKECEDLKLWDEAFSHFTAGAALKRASLDYDDKRDQETIDALTKAQKNLSVITDKGNRDVEPIFIIGMPRSGSTLVERVITGHSAIHSAGELRHMPSIIQKMCGIEGLQLKTDAIESALKSADANTIAAEYLNMAARDIKGNTCFVDKLPHNYLYLPLLLQAFPRAKFVHVKRGALDTCFANFKHLFAESSFHSYDQEELANHYVRYETMMALWGNTHKDAIITVQYENFVKDFETEAKALIEALGKPWEDSCLAFDTRTDMVTTASALQVREQPHARSIGHSDQYGAHLDTMRSILTAAKLI